MSKYTAGPWGFRTNPCHGADVVDLSSHWIDGPSGKPIANIYEYYHGESEANARLIAAAPTMCALIERLAEKRCEYGNGADCNMLPQGVRRSPCLPCQARALLDETNA